MSIKHSKMKLGSERPGACDIERTYVTATNVSSASEVDIKHLMTGPKGNSEFCFPDTPNVPRGEAEGNI